MHLRFCMISFQWILCIFYFKREFSTFHLHWHSVRSTFAHCVHYRARLGSSGLKRCHMRPCTWWWAFASSWMKQLWDCLCFDVRAIYLCCIERLHWRHNHDATLLPHGKTGVLFCEKIVDRVCVRYGVFLLCSILYQQIYQRIQGKRASFLPVSTETREKKAVVAISDAQNFRQKLQALALSKSRYLYTRRKLSVSSVERSPLVVANSVDAEVTCVFNFSHTNFNWMQIENCRYYSRLVWNDSQFFAKSNHWDIVWCALVVRSASRSWERAVPFKNVNLPESLIVVVTRIKNKSQKSFLNENKRM